MKDTSTATACFFILALCFFILSCKRPVDPTTGDIRIYYENPMGCDEVSGAVVLQASVRGDSAPVPAAMQYRIWTDNASAALTFTGYAPDYKAEFDSTAIRDGYVFYHVVPLDAAGSPIDIKAAPYNAKGILPPFKGFMIRNGEIDLTKPLIVMGAPLEPDTGALDNSSLSQQLEDHLTFGASLMSHLNTLGFIPDFCQEDQTTVVLDPLNPSVASGDTPQNPVDLLAQPVSGPVSWNPGTACSTGAFFENPVPNGIPDSWEFTALGNILVYKKLGPVDSKPQALAFFSETIDSLADRYNLVGDWFSMFAFERPVAYAEPEDILEEKFESQIQNGATSVFVYDFYNKANEFEMSSGSWPHFQQALDKANKKLGTSVRLGAICTNKFQLLSYKDLYRSFFLGVRHLVGSFSLPADTKIGIILAVHGSSTTNKLYDVSNIVNNPILDERTNAYFALRRPLIHPSSPPCLIRYSEYSNTVEDGLPGVGEQVRDWIAEGGYDYIFVFPMEWTWGSRDCWQELRKYSVALLDLDNSTRQQVFVRDAHNRTTLQLGSTTLVIGETIFEQKSENPDAYNALKKAAGQLLADRLKALHRF